MEQNFQTSFIPKKPMIEERSVEKSRPLGMLTIASIFIFFTVLIATGGLYFYKGLLEREKIQMQKDLDLAKNRFEPERIAQLELLDRRLEASKMVLGKHVSIAPIFKALEDVTMKSVRYTQFSYTFDGEGSRVVVNLKGTAVGYRSIALQSDIFNENKYFIDPVFSNLSLDSKGDVLFDLEFSVDPASLNYERILETTPAITN